MAEKGGQKILLSVEKDLAKKSSSDCMIKADSYEDSRYYDIGSYEDQDFEGTDELGYSDDFSYQDLGKYDDQF